MSKAFPGPRNAGSHGTNEMQRGGLGCAGCYWAISAVFVQPFLREDIKKCWAASNLFPQDARENLENHDKMPPPETLLPLRDIWPASWCGELP